MSRRRYYLAVAAGALTILLSQPAASRRTDDSDQSCGVNVYIHQGMALPNGMLQDAISQASAMFHEAGVDLRLLNYAPRHSEGRCGAPIAIQFEDERDDRGMSDALAACGESREQEVLDGIKHL